MKDSDYMVGNKGINRKYCDKAQSSRFNLLTVLCFSFMSRACLDRADKT